MLRNDGDQVSTEPTGVRAQSVARMILPSSPPPRRQSGVEGAVGGSSWVDITRRMLRFQFLKHRSRALAQAVDAR